MEKVILSVPTQEVSLDIWDKKYRLKTKDNIAIDEDIDDTYIRVAKAISEVEKPEVRGMWFDKFLDALRKGAIPAGRIISNAGAQEYKPETSTINCTVSGTIEDSMKDILKKVSEAGLTLKAGCGIGYEFSTLRPKNSFVNGAGATTSGPLSFMDIFDKTCFTIASAGARRGAQMATFDISHPDILDFIKVKREAGRLRQFNLSALITKDFMEAVKNDLDWKLVFPISQTEKVLDNIDITDTENVVWKKSVLVDGYVVNEDGLTAHKVYKKIKAKRLWDTIMSSTYDFAEPGFILIDEVNKMNNNWFCENIRATNPCGEQPLPPYGSCLLGSINLTKFVVNAFRDNAYFDYESFNEVVYTFTRMLDNVVELNGLALEEQRNEIFYKRRHGMGFLGLGSTLVMLKIKYGSEESLVFTNNVSHNLAVIGFRAGIDLAKEKGPAPIMFDNFTITKEMLNSHPELSYTAKVGDVVAGLDLLCESNYLKKLPKDIIENIKLYGCRFTHHTSIAPTGTISLSLANNASNGIEPSFAHSYSRNVIREGKKTKEKVTVYSFEALAYKEFCRLNGLEFDPNNLPDYFVDSSTISPKEHVDIQATAQQWIDSSISKTINVPTDIKFDDFKDIYMYAYDKGLKGCTTFRFNPEAFQGVLVTEKDLENTQYEFTFENGQKMVFKGNDEIQYDGEVHTAANLYDALKEGMYGKF